VIVGGRHSRWLAAFRHPGHLKASRKIDGQRFTCHRSSKIPTVVVGDGSTAAFPVMIPYFSLDDSLSSRNRATFNLGIRTRVWRRKGFTL